MGAFFDNLHILKSDKYDLETLKNELSDKLKIQGFSLLPEGADGDVFVMIYEPGEGSWVSIESDAFMFDSEEAIRTYTDPLSLAFNTDVIAATCFDSDYLRLALLNSVDNTDGWINVGKSYDPLIRRTKVAPWKKLVKDTEGLKATIKKDHACAEEAFEEIAEMIGMQPQQTMLGCGGEELLDGKITRMEFSAPEGKIKPPKLQLHSYNAPPIKIGKFLRVSFINTGDKAKGLKFIFMGECVEKGEITFEDVSLFYDDKHHPIELQESELMGGEKCYVWKDPYFQLPPAVNENLPLVKQINLGFDREISVCCTPKGNTENPESLRIVGIPLSNPMEGQVSWINSSEYC